MKIGEVLYFAPGLAFTDIDFSENELPRSYQKRITGFYLTPALELVASGHGFAAGLLALCAIDALGKVEHPKNTVSDRFKSYCTARLRSFSNEEEAKLLYDAYRCGIVHEARAKDGAEITLETDSTVEHAPQGIRINPAHLVYEITKAMNEQMDEIVNSEDKRRSFKKYILSQFKEELAGLPIDI